MPKTTKTTEQLFWDKVDKSGSCWNWKAYRLPSRGKPGHGQFWIGNKNMLAHRYSYELHKEPIPENLIVRHTCDNMACVNPDHLITGTHQDNVNDAVERGRNYKPVGVLHPKAKFTEKQVLDIKKLKAFGLSATEIANVYNVSKSTILSITKRHWKNIQVTVFNSEAAGGSNE